MVYEGLLVEVLEQQLSCFCQGECLLLQLIELDLCLLSDVLQEPLERYFGFFEIDGAYLVVGSVFESDCGLGPLDVLVIHLVNCQGEESTHQQDKSIACSHFDLNALRFEKEI